MDLQKSKLHFWSCAFTSALLIAGIGGAQAATNVHPSATVRSSEKGVSVYRGPAPKIEDAGALLAGGEKLSIHKFVVLKHKNCSRLRHARVHGFYSGNVTPGRKFTHGFFADRVSRKRF